MSDTHQLGAVEDTLFVPMLGRIYSSRNFPGILYDTKALELEPLLPRSIIEADRQTQYTYLASASRSANMDRYIRRFLSRHDDGIIAQIGCGLETTFFRNDNGKNVWFEIDLPNVIEYRKSVLEGNEREILLPGDAFKEEWVTRIRSEYPTAPILVVASGLFYYFEEKDVLSLIQMLSGYGNIELIFDTVSKSGMGMMRKKHLKTVGVTDVPMFFYVDSLDDLKKKLPDNVSALTEEPFYKQINMKGLSFSTKVSMTVSDLLNMVKMVDLSMI